MTEWNVAEMAAGVAAVGSWGKFRWARTTASPEFCMPTSTDTVLRTISSYPKTFANR
jgi:hypothetical protein